MTHFYTKCRTLYWRVCSIYYPADKQTMALWH